MAGVRWGSGGPPWPFLALDLLGLEAMWGVEWREVWVTVQAGEYCLQ